MSFVDKHAQINSKDTASNIWLGNNGVNVPDNATRLQNNVLNMNIKQFKPSQAPKDALDLISGNPTNKKQNKNMYFSSLVMQTHPS